MHTLLLFALLTWPFNHAGHLNQNHTRRYHARHLEHVQAARASLLIKARKAHRHAEHPSLIHF